MGPPQHLNSEPTTETRMGVVTGAIPEALTECMTPYSNQILQGLSSPRELQETKQAATWPCQKTELHEI